MPMMLFRSRSAALISVFLSVFVSPAGAALVGPTLSPPVMDCPVADADPLVSPVPALRIVVSLPILYFPGPHRSEPGHVLPESLNPSALLAPLGSLRWAGIDEAATIGNLAFGPLGQDFGRRAPDRERAAGESPNVELLTGLPAPEPPALMLAGLGVLAGGLVAQRTRCRPSPRRR